MNIREKLINWIISKLTEQKTKSYDAFLSVCIDIAKHNSADAPEYIEYLHSLKIHEIRELYAETLEVMKAINL